MKKSILSIFFLLLIMKLFPLDYSINNIFSQESFNNIISSNTGEEATKLRFEGYSDLKKQFNYFMKKKF